MTNYIENPILPGFNPDPSIIRVEDDYFIATSTFEWFPGVCIYHSKDLKNWRLIGHPLTRSSQLDMRGNPDSCGVWAPCLTHHNGRFYLCFTDVKRFNGAFKDTHNYIVSTDDIYGEWDEPIYVNSSGFDPSLFFDQDGKVWFLNMLWDHRPKDGRNNWLPNSFFAGTLLQQIDLTTGKLHGEVYNIFPGSSIGLSEGPHLYQRDDWYYLLLAEGGTGKDHACSFARSRDITGPYEADPSGPILTSKGHPNIPLKRAGHGDWVETPSGECYLVHLCSRPLPFRGRSVMGRETAIQRIKWTAEGWPRLASDSNEPQAQLEATIEDTSLGRVTEQRVDFDSASLPPEFQTLRIPLPASTLSLTEAPGFLRLYGRESLGSLFHQALIARRQQAFCFSAETSLIFDPDSFQQMAGLVCYYNGKKYYYLHISRDSSGRKILDISMCCNEELARYPLDEPIFIPEHGEIKLKATINFDVLTFYFAISDQNWQSFPCQLDYSVLSDEVGDNGADANFTGAFVGLCCQDLSGSGKPADFAYFHYKEES